MNHLSLSFVFTDVIVTVTAAVSIATVVWRNEVTQGFSVRKRKNTTLQLTGLWVLGIWHTQSQHFRQQKKGSQNCTELLQEQTKGSNSSKLVPPQENDIVQEKAVSPQREGRQTYFCLGSTVKSIITLWARLSQTGKLKALASFTTSMAKAGLSDAFAVSINSSSNSFL